MTTSTPEPTIKFYVARHGQDEDNAAGILNGHRDMPLTDIGIHQAETVANKIKNAGLNFDFVYSSPLQRAKRTADIIVQNINLEDDTEGDANANGEVTKSTSSSRCAEVQILDDLIERNFGIMTGTPISEITQRCGASNILRTSGVTYFLSPDSAETFPDLIERANKMIAHLQKTHANAISASILLVTHGDFGKMLYAAYYKLPWEDVLKQFHFGNSEVILLSKDSSPDQAHVFEIEQHN